MRRIAIITAFAAWAAPAVALACGGFFCDNAAPVVQSGEQILFSRDAQDRLLVYVRIQYQGPAERFSWVLPVPGEPEVGVGTNAMFTALDASTTPSFQVTQQGEGCPPEDGGGSSCGSDESIALMADGTGRNCTTVDCGVDPGVQPVRRGSAGPYDYVVLQATDPDDLTRWLVDNGFDVPDAGRELLRLYVDGEHQFVAVRLRKDREAGDIVPIVLRFEEPLPCVPLRLTAVAATPDMPVTVFVLGQHRAVPRNWAEVELNWARLSWGQGGQNYVQLVGEAVDASPNGQGFVTEFAGSPSVLREAVWDPSLGTEDLNFANDNTLVESLRATNRFTDAELVLFLDRNLTDPWDPERMEEAVERELFAPRREAQALLDGAPMLTRLYTTVSPEEMTSDPIFDFDAELPDVPAVKEAVMEFACLNGETIGILTTPDGRKVEFPTFDVPTAEEQGPAALRVSVRDQDTMRAVLLQDNTPDIAPPDPDSGCATRNRGAVWFGLPLLVLVVLAARRRR